MKQHVVTDEGQLIEAKHDRVRKDVTRSSVINAQHFEHRTMTNRDGSPVRVRRSGKTQIWKTRPNEFKVPVKYGLYDNAYITHLNAHEWYIPE